MKGARATVPATSPAPAARPPGWCLSPEGVRSDIDALTNDARKNIETALAMVELTRDAEVSDPRVGRRAARALRAAWNDLDVLGMHVDGLTKALAAKPTT